MIPDEAVEAAARAWFDHGRVPSWDAEPPGEKRMDCSRAHSALKAAAPHMLASFGALADEWTRDAEAAMPSVDHGYGDAGGAREALALREAAERIRHLIGEQVAKDWMETANAASFVALTQATRATYPMLAKSERGASDA